MRNACPSRQIVLTAVVSGLCAAGCVSPQKAAEMEAAAAARSELTGRAAPDFTLRDQNGNPVHLADERGKWVVLYFYPADGTPGCTCQAREFTRNFPEFAKMNADVFGISPDSIASHRRVVQDYKLKVPLLADPEHEAMTAYGAWVQTPYGSRVIRSTVLVDPAGNIAYHWPEVIPEGHAARVRDKLAELEKTAPTRNQGTQ